MIDARLKKDPQKESKKKKVTVLDKYVIFSLISVIIFTITAIIYQIMFPGEQLSDSLITCFYALFGGELYMLCMIKKLKLKGGN